MNAATRYSSYNKRSSPYKEDREVYVLFALKAERYAGAHEIISKCRVALSVYARVCCLSFVGVALRAISYQCYGNRKIEAGFSRYPCRRRLCGDDVTGPSETTTPSDQIL